MWRKIWLNSTLLVKWGHVRETFAKVCGKIKVRGISGTKVMSHRVRCSWAKITFLLTKHMWKLKVLSIKSLFVVRVSVLKSSWKRGHFKKQRNYQNKSNSIFRQTNALTFLHFIFVPDWFQPQSLRPCSSSHWLSSRSGDHTESAVDAATQRPWCSVFVNRELAPPPSSRIPSQEGKHLVKPQPTSQITVWVSDNHEHHEG